MILDVMLPGRDGFEVVHELREAGEYVPVLMLTARGRPEDVLRGFEAGADDYLTKPFELAILLARVRGLLRRSHWSAAAITHPSRCGRILTLSGKTLDLKALELRVGERSYHLTVMECDLLDYLCRTRARRSRGRRSSRTSGISTRTPTPARSTTSSSGCAATSKTTRAARAATVRGVGYKAMP